jgi:cell division protein ZapE
VPAGLYRDGLQRERFLPAIRLLEERLDILAIDGPTDYRLRQLTQAPIYLDARDAATPARLGALFETLAGGCGAAAPDPPSDRSTAGMAALGIAGRSIPVVRVSDRVVWFEFAAICEGARSQEDYLELARDYPSVIVADVPVFDARRDDAARRFVALVDEFYDRGVNLILSAQAPPAELYRGERLAFEFRRTVSRLVEMQSEAYLARAHRP